MATLKRQKQSPTYTGNSNLKRYNQSKIYSYQYENKSALDILNEYQNKINRGEWISTEDRAKYKAAVDSYTSSGNALRSASKFYGTKYSDEEEKGWRDYLASLSGNYNSINDFYNQFENETMFDYFASPYKADFKENSAYVSTQYGKPELNKWSGMYSDTGFSDIEYDYINKNTVAEGVKFTDSQAAGPNLSGVSNSQNHSMTDDEIAIFNYLYKTKGKEAAYEYTNYLKDELNARQRQETKKMWADFAAEDPAKASLFSVFISPLQSTAYISQAADFLKNGTIDQNANYNKVLHVNTAIRDQVSKDVEQNWGAVGSFAYQTGMGMGDFLLNTAITGGNQALSLALMGTSAAANTVMSAKDRGLNDTQAFTLGTIAGAAEIAMEKIGLDALFDKALLGKDALTYVLKNALAEGGEEFGSSVINLLADVIVSGDKSQWQTAINQNIANGDDETTAWWKAVGEQALSLGADFLGGAVSGGIMGSGGAFVNATGNAINGAALKNEYGLNVGNLAYQALSLDNTNSFAQQMQNKVAKGQELSNYQVGRLAQQIENNNYEAKVKEANTTIKNRLLDLGETLWLDDVANAITKQALGEKLSTFEKTVLKQSQHGSEVVKEVKNGLLFSDSNTTETATAQTQKGVPTVNSTPENATATEAKTSASGEGVSPTIVTKNAEGKTVKSEISGIEVDGDKATFTLANGEKVSANKATFQTDTQKLVADIAVEKVSRVEGFSTEAATAMVKGYDGSVSPSEYITTFEEAFKLGRDNAQIKELTRLSKDSGVIGRALLHAYDAGLQSRNVALEATNPENSVLQNGNESAIINTESEIIQDEGKTATESISLRRGGERIDGAYSEGQIPSVEGSAGQNQEWRENRSRPAESEAARLLDEGRGREVRVADLGILNGSKQQTVWVIDNEADFTPNMKQAYADAEKQGLTARFFVGDNILIEEKNGSITGVNGYILGNQVLIRADHDMFTSEQIFGHEAAHDRLAKAGAEQKSKIIAAARQKLADVGDKVAYEALAEFYEYAYSDSNLTDEELWEEIVCDIEGGMNWFADERGELMQLAIQDVKGIVESATVKTTEGVTEGKASRNFSTKGKVAKYLPDSKVGKDNREYLYHQLLRIYSGINDGIADGIAIANGKTVFIVDSGKDNGKLDFGVRRMRNVSADIGREKFIRSENDKARSNGNISDELLERLGYGRSSDSGRNMRRESGSELQADTRKSDNQQGRVSGEDADQRGIGKASRELDTEYLSSVNRGDMDTAQRMVDEAAKDWGAITNGNTRAPRPIHLYHGTGAFGFTRFHDGRIYATVEESVASGYNRGRGLGRVRSSSLGYIPNDGTVDTAIKNAKNVLGAELTKLDDAKTQDIISKADNILKEVATKVAELDEVTDYGKAGEFFEYLTEKYGEDKAVQWTNNLDSLHYMLAAEYTAEEIVEDGEWLVHDLERYHEWKQSLSDLWLEERDAIKESTLDKVFRYLLGYEYGDALIDIEFGLGRLLDNRQKLVNTNGSLVYLEDIIDSVEMAKDTGIYDLYGHPGEKPLVIDEGKRFWDAIPFENGFRSTDYIVKWAKERGYTSVLFKTVLDPSSGGSANIYADEWVFFDSNQVKSADPVTYDDNGNVIPLSERFNPEEKDIRYSRELDLIDYVNEKADGKEYKPLTNRELLASALESVAVNADERKILESYNAEVKDLNRAQARLDKVGAELKELIFEKGARDKAAIERLTKEKNALLKKINKSDKRLLKIEAMEPVKAVMEQAKKKAYKRAAEKGREALHRNVEGRHKTAKKQAIRGVAMDLEKLLNRGTKERNVKKGERDLVAKVLELTDMLYASDDELLLNGIGTEFTKAEAEAMDDYMALYDQYHSYDNAVTANKQKRAELRQQMAEVKKQFEGVLERERKRISEANASGIFDAIIKEYESLNKSEEAYIKQAYKPEVAEYLKQMKDTIGNANLSDMSLEQLETLHKAMSLIKHLIQDSNKLFRNGKTESIETRREAIFIAIDALKNRFDKDYPEIIGKALDKINELGWNNLRPVDAFELTDANALIELYWDVISAQNTYARDVEEAKAALIKARESHGYAKWNLDDVTTFETEDGRNFNVTLGEMMSIYAYSKRDQADKHMREGGFQHEKKAIYKEKGIYKLRKKEALTYKVNDKMRLDIINSLTKEQRAYVDEVQKVLTDWGEKGNEASRIIYGIDLFTEKVYFPLESATDYLSSASTELGKTVTTASLSATGMAKATIPGASNPIILRGFDEVVLEHFDKMAKYHSYLVPIDNLRKMLDAQGKDNNNNIVSTKALIGSKLGDGASKYFQDYITDLNGGMNIGGAKNPLESFFGKSKAMSVMANISVWVQQYFSIVRAFSEVNPKYFIPFMGESFKKADMKLYAEMKKYAPITTIKEMGGFDVGSNRTIQDYVGYEGTGKAKGKAWKKFQDMLGVGAEAMDKLGWMTIWKGVKKEVAASGKYKTGSEEYFKACGERFERIIAKTQVYDSVNSKSAYMRSKNPAVKYLVSFMGEPTTILGMAEVSIIKFERAVETGDKAKIKEAGGKLAGTMAAISVSTALTSVAKSLVYALRDDDEDETYLEKYAQSLGKAFADDINIFKYIPVARDIVSAWEGFTTERPDMTLLQDVIDSVKKVINKLNDEDSTTEEIFSGYMNAALAIGNIFGIPAKNVYRDIKGLITTIANIGNGYRTDFGEKFAEGFLDTSKNKSQKLYDAIVSGDENLAKYYQSTYKDFSAYKTALRKTLRDNDERIKEAAEAKNSGDIETYESILQEIIDEGNFDSIIIEEAIDAEANSYYSDMKSDDMRIIESVMATISGDNNKRIEIEKALVEEGRFTVDLISKARESEMKSLNNLLKEAKELTARGRYSDAEAIYNDLIKKGYTKEFIEAQKNKR